MVRARGMQILVTSMLLSSCRPGDIDTSNTRQNAVDTLLETSRIPRGWRYTVRPDRIRNRVDYLATLPNEDSDPARDQTIILVIQELATEDVGVFFRGRRNVVGCATVCGIAFRAGSEVGTWTGIRSYDGNEIILDVPADALSVIRSSSEMIIEVPSDLGGQYTFRVSGLTWPPSVSN